MIADALTKHVLASRTMDLLTRGIVMMSNGTASHAADSVERKITIRTVQRKLHCSDNDIREIEVRSQVPIQWVDQIVVYIEFDNAHWDNGC